MPPRVSPILDINLYSRGSQSSLSHAGVPPHWALCCATALLWTVHDARILGTAISPVFDIFLLKERLCTTLGETQVRPQSFLVQLDDNTELNQEWLERKEHLGKRCLETQNSRVSTTR